MSFRLTKKQAIAFEYLTDNETTEVLFGGGAGGGKSAFGCFWLITNCANYPGSRWLMGRAKLKTLKETTLNSFFEVAKMGGLLSGKDFVYNQQSGVIKFSNGSEILTKDLFLYPSDPNFDELGSLEISGAFIDECNQIVEKAWNIVKSRIRYKLNEFNILPKMLGTCNPAKNYVYQRFYDLSEIGKLPKERKFVQSLLADNKHVSSYYGKSLLELDENSRQRLLFGNWRYDDDPTVLITYENILNSFSNSFVEKGKKYITSDIARYGRDKTVICVWDGWRLIKVETIDKSGLDYVNIRIKALALQHEVPLLNIIVDEDGVGGGVKDFLRCKGFVNNSSPLDTELSKKADNQNFNNLKSQCYFKLADTINANLVYFDIDGESKEKLTEELQYVKQHNMDSDSKKAVLPKDKVKELLGRSPDYSDAVMMRAYFDLKPIRAMNNHLVR